MQRRADKLLKIHLRSFRIRRKGKGPTHATRREQSRAEHMLGAKVVPKIHMEK